MKLSEAVRQVKFEIKPAENGRLLWKSIGAVLFGRFAEPRRDNETDKDYEIRLNDFLAGNFPLAFAEPIFLTKGQDLDCQFWDLIPLEARPMESTENIVFLCNFINCLAVKCRWSEERVADWLEKIEARVEENETIKLRLQESALATLQNGSRRGLALNMTS